MGILESFKEFFTFKKEQKSEVINEQPVEEVNENNEPVVFKNFPTNNLTLLMFSNPDYDDYGVHLYGEYVSPYQSITVGTFDKIIPLIRTEDNKFYNIVSQDEVKFDKDGNLTPESREFLMRIGYNIGGLELRDIRKAKIIDNEEFNVEPDFNNYKIIIKNGYEHDNWLQMYTKLNYPGISTGTITPNQMQNIMATIEQKCMEDLIPKRVRIYKEKARKRNLSIHQDIINNTSDKNPNNSDNMGM